MKKNIVRVVILGVLILVCIWQTIILWLGDVSSHNFFAAAQETGYQQYYVFPKQMWAINGYAYIIEGNNSEEGRRYKLMTELLNEMKRENTQLTSHVNVRYEDLLSMPGIVYQYALPLTLDEITGRSFVENKKEADAKVRELFIDVSANDTYKTYVYLVDDENRVRYMMTINNRLPIHANTLAYFTEEAYKYQVQDYMNYQSSLLSINDKDYFKRNVFYPLNGKQQLLYYKEVLFRPVIIEGDEERLEGMVSHLFTNPLYKHKVVSQEGITFFDNLNLSVKFMRAGTLEFKKSEGNDNEKLTPAQRMNKVISFIDDTEAIPDGIKKGLYLSDIVNNGDNKGVTYYFDYTYDNHDVIMSSRLKEKLGLKAYLELTISGGKIISGKWLMMEPQTISNEEIEGLSTSCNEVTTQIYNGAMPEEQDKLEDLTCAYVFDNQQEVLKFKWIAVKNNEMLEFE